MKGRSTIAVVAAAFGLGGLIGMLAWFASAHTKEDALSNAQPTWMEMPWPFATDEWGKGKAFQCKALSCGTEINLYIRAKVGFCNCTTGIADDGDLDRMGDLDLIAGQVAARGDGHPITVAHMKGRSRAYTLTARNPLGKTAISVAFNDRCDMVVATALLPGYLPDAVEPKVIEFLNGKIVMHWVEVTLGL